MTIQTAYFAVQRDGSQYSCVGDQIGDRLKDGDLLLVQRDGVIYQSSSNAIRDTDLLACTDNGTTYNCTGQLFKTLLGGDDDIIIFNAYEFIRAWEPCTDGGFENPAGPYWMTQTEPIGMGWMKDWDTLWFASKPGPPGSKFMTVSHDQLDTFVMPYKGSISKDGTGPSAPNTFGSVFTWCTNTDSRWFGGGTWQVTSEGSGRNTVYTLKYSYITNSTGLQGSSSATQTGDKIGAILTMENYNTSDYDKPIEDGRTLQGSCLIPGTNDNWLCWGGGVELGGVWQWDFDSSNVLPDNWNQVASTAETDTSAMFGIVSLVTTGTTTAMIGIQDGTCKLRVSSSDPKTGAPMTFTGLGVIPILPDQSSINPNDEVDIRNTLANLLLVDGVCYLTTTGINPSLQAPYDNTMAGIFYQDCGGDLSTLTETNWTQAVTTTTNNQDFTFPLGENKGFFMTQGSLSYDENTSTFFCITTAGILTSLNGTHWRLECIGDSTADLSPGSLTWMPDYGIVSANAGNVNGLGNESMYYNSPYGFQQRKQETIDNTSYPT